MPSPKPVVLTQRAAITGEPAGEPLVIIGDFPSTALTAVPASFADLAAVRTFFNTHVNELKSSPYFS